MSPSSLDFTAAFWLFPLLAAPGLWLAARLYLKSTPRRPLLAALTAAAWLLLALLAVAPLWRSRAETWHPPVVVLAVDESPSYAALGARDAAVRAMGMARAHYEALGFRVVELGFAERVVPLPVSGAPRDAGTLTFLSSLRRYMNEGAGRESGKNTETNFPNLQAVLLWSDGRFTEGDVPGGWPARVFPVASPVYTGEVQGENAEVDFAVVGGALLTVEWRILGAGEAGHPATSATVEIRDGEKLLWKAETPHTSARFTLPPQMSAASADPSTWILRVRPGAAGRNALAQNDTVPLRIRGRDRPAHIFVRPLASLEERGLLDALRAPEESSDGSSPAFSVAAVAPESLHATRRDVVWIRAARARLPALEIEAGAPRIVYHFPAARGPSESSHGAMFASDARLAWRADGAEFLPAGAVRLADLGVERLWLRAADSSVEALAWAEQDGRRGLLFWRERAVKGVGSRERNAARFGFAAPPLWRAGFVAGNRTAGEGTGAAGLGPRWVRGAGAWAGHLAQGSGPRVSIPEPLFAGHPFAIAVRGTKDGLDEKRAHLSIRGGNGAVHAIATGPGTLRFEVPGLSARTYAAQIRQGNADAAPVLWSGVLRVIDPRMAELARLGTDADALDALAARTAGNVIYFNGNDSSKYVWPALSGGQARSSRARVVPLAPPFVTAFLIIALLCVAWTLRKRLRLD